MGVLDPAMSFLSDPFARRDAARAAFPSSKRRSPNGIFPGVARPRGFVFPIG